MPDDMNPSSVLVWVAVSRSSCLRASEVTIAVAALTADDTVEDGEALLEDRMALAAADATEESRSSELSSYSLASSGGSMRREATEINGQG